MCTANGDGTFSAGMLADAPANAEIIKTLDSDGDNMTVSSL